MKQEKISANSVISNWNEICSELYEVLKYVDKEAINKIPESFLKMIERDRKKEYIKEIDLDKPIEEWELSREARGMLAYIFVNYWTTEEEKVIIFKKFNNDIRKSESIKQNEYSSKEFKNVETVNKPKTEDLQIKKYKKNNFIENIAIKIKHFIEKILKNNRR